jgi:hypothetical protein
MANSNTDGTVGGYAGAGLRKYSNMEAFDLLPKAAREALRNSDHNWSAAQLLHHMRRRDPRVRTAKDAAEYIRSSDVTKHVKDVAAGLPIASRYATEA